MRRYSFLFLLLLLVAEAAHAYSDEDIRQYIKTFEPMAIREQIRTGIPASITLAQGILETAAGTSELCTQASNHFGIKCNNGWQGLTFLHDDDKKDECFRKYEHAESSYLDHSNFLKYNKRYASLFDISPIDFEGWARGLKKCGYATSSTYADKLIGIINRFQLQQYTVAALNRPDASKYLASADADAPIEALVAINTTIPELITSPTSTKVSGGVLPSPEAAARAGNKQENEINYDAQANFSIPQASVADTDDNASFYEITTLHGIRGFYAKKGDNLLEYAIKNRIRFAKLLELNDLEDAPLSQSMFIYLDKKNNLGSRPYHKVEKGETMQYISQAEGLKMDALRSYNRLAEGEEPAVGAVLYLQNISEKKPALASDQTSVITVGYTAASSEPSNTGMIKKESIENLNVPDNIRKEIANQEGVQIATKQIPVEVNIEEIKASENVQKEIAKQEGEKLDKRRVRPLGAGDDIVAVEPIRTASQKPEVAAKPIPVYNSGNDKLDAMKRKFDRTVYQGTDPNIAPPTPPSQQQKAAEQTEVNRAAKISTVPEVKDGAPADALRKHMDEVKKGKSDFVPKQTKK